MKTYLFSLVLFFFSSVVSAQKGRDVSGVVQDTTGEFIFGATVKLVPLSTPTDTIKDTLMIRTYIDGNFAFKNVKTSQFTILVTRLLLPV